MRRVMDSRSDEYLGRIKDYPLLKARDIVRLGKVNYRVIDVSGNRKEIEVYVSKEAVSWAATPDYTMELKR